MEEDVASDSSVAWKAVLLRDAPDFVWLRFMPLHGALETIMMPIAQFSHMLERGIRASIPLIISHVMRNDHVVDVKGGTVPGLLYLEPDLGSAYLHASSSSSLSPSLGTTRNRFNRMVMMTSLVESNGTAAATCPRSQLARLDATLRSEHRLGVLFGFEVEVVFMRRKQESQSSSTSTFTPVGHHSWCHVPAEDIELLQIVEEVVCALALVDAAVEKFHAEAAPGQWEFVLSPRPPVEAVDMLLRARDTIITVVQQYGIRATLHPRPSAGHPGTGAHTHISATSLEETAAPDQDDTKKLQVESFFAGILRHLPSIAAIALPIDASYVRLESGMWSGGEYACWGWENRETPLRRITLSRFEFKLMCGTANPYLTMAALLAAAIDGLEHKLPLVAGDCKSEASRLSAEERRLLRITDKLPSSIEESLEVLQMNTALLRVLGECMVEAYIAVARGWNETLRQMGMQERHAYIIEHY